MQDKNKTVLIGLNHSIDSYVTLYLLKKQGYLVHGIYLDFLNEKLIENYDLAPPHCKADDISQIKNVCESLGVPFFGSLCREEFEEEVIQKGLHRKFEGKYFNPCFHCTSLKIYFLYLKMKKLDCQFMSTGHYIKVRKQQTSKKFAVFMANDLEADQSELFSGVKQEVLSSMILPLGDLMKTEVHKIFRRAFPHLAEKVGQDRKSCHLFQDINKTAKKNISEDLLVQGKIMMKSKNLSLGEHHGFHEFKVAEEIEEVNAPMDFKGDKFYIYNFSFSENYVYAEPEKYLAIQYLFVKVVYAGADYKVATPLNVAIKIGDDSEIHEVDIYFKSLGYAFILLDKKIKTIGMGAHIYIYTEIGKQGRILAFAEVVKQIPPKGLIEKEELDEADEGPDEEETIELLNSGKEHKF